MADSSKWAGKKVEDLVYILKPLCETYRLLVGSAEEFNRITLAHKKDAVDAIKRADDLGGIIDDIIDTLDCMVGDWLNQLKKFPLDTPLSSEEREKAITSK